SPSRPSWTLFPVAGTCETTPARTWPGPQLGHAGSGSSAMSFQPPLHAATTTTITYAKRIAPSCGGCARAELAKLERKLELIVDERVDPRPRERELVDREARGREQRALHGRRQPDERLADPRGGAVRDQVRGDADGERDHDA